MRFYWLIISALAVWRLTHLLAAEDGPWDVFVRIRRKIGDGFWGWLLDCFYCLSLWIAAPFAYLVGESLRERLMLWLALSAGAILIERGTSKEVGSPPYFEDGGQDDALLRTGESPTPGDNIRVEE